MSFRIDHERLLENYKAIWAKIEDLKILNETLFQSIMTDM